MIEDMIGGLLAGFVEGIGHVHPLFYMFVPIWVLTIVPFLLSPVTVLLPQFAAGKLSWPSANDFPDEWVIHGKKYNLKPFYRNHPGGSFVLRSCRGSDCTGLIESYHPFIDSAVILRKLNNYEIQGAAPAEQPRMAFSDPFYVDLKQMVREHFKGKGKNAHKMPWPYMALCFLAWVGMWAAFFLIVTQDAIWLAPVAGFLAWITFCTFTHDGSHNAAVSRPWGNRLLSRLAFPFGVNGAAWHIQHIMSHHIDTNEEEDVDLFHFEPFMSYFRNTGNHTRLFHSLRLLLLMAVSIPHLAVAVPYQLLTGLEDDIRGNRMYCRVKAITVQRAEMKWEMLAEFSLQSAFLILLSMALGFCKAMAIYMSIVTAASFFFFIFTQGSHYQKECFLAPEEMEHLSFAKRQVAASVDFEVGSSFWGFVSGGLNGQALHHCLPSISQAHYRALYPKFQRVCKKHGVELKVAPSVTEFFWGFFEYSRCG